MSGHSKWSTIHRQKEVVDKKRGQLFSKLGRAIAIAAREGIDPEANFRLRLAIEKAREANMPKSNIDRALHQAQGKLGDGGLEEIVYEGYGPAKVAIIVEVLTDNRNRTTAEIKNIFEKNGGKLTSPGAVAFQFTKTGLLTILKKNQSSEEQVLKIIDLGPEEVEETDETIEVYARPEELMKMKAKLEENGFQVKRAEFTRRLQATAAIVKITNEKTAKKILDFMDRLEDHDDVQKVYANFDIPAEFVG